MNKKPSIGNNREHAESRQDDLRSTLYALEAASWPIRSLAFLLAREVQRVSTGDAPPAVDLSGIEDLLEKADADFEAALSQSFALVSTQKR